MQLRITEAKRHRANLPTAVDDAGAHTTWGDWAGAVAARRASKSDTGINWTNRPVGATRPDAMKRAPRIVRRRRACIAPGSSAMAETFLTNVVAVSKLQGNSNCAT